MKNVWLVLAVLVFCGGSLWAVEDPLAIKAEIRQVPPFTYFCVEGKGPYTGIPQAEATLLKEFASSRVKAADKEITVYWNSPLFVKPAELKWDVGFPVSGSPIGPARLTAKKFTFFKVAVALHVGPWTTTYVTINALYDWIAKKGYKTVGGPCVERYLDDPGSNVPDALKKTEIWIPIQ